MSEEPDQTTAPSFDLFKPTDGPALPKKPFTSPKLTVYGDIVENTKRGTSGHDGNRKSSAGGG
jgi:hypothetical protein